MALQKLILSSMAAAAVSASGCSGEKDERETKQETRSTAAEKTAGDEKYFLRRVPDPCVLLSLERAQAIVGSDIDVGAMAGNGSFSLAGGVCNYLATAGKHIGVTIQLRAHTLVNSSSMTTEELIAASEKIKGVPGAGFVETSGPGVKNLALVSDSQVYLDVFTGIGGAAPVGYSIPSEMLLHYTISDRTKSGEQNLNILKELAEEQYAAMDEMARREHE